MKIGILVDEIAPGSAPKLIGFPIKELKKLGHDAEAIVLIEKDHWKKNQALYDSHLRDIKVRYIFPFFPRIFKVINFKFPGMSFFSLHHILAIFFAHRVVKRNEFDIIIAHCQYSTFAANNIKRIKNIPYLLLLWDPSTYTAKKIYKSRLGSIYLALYFFAYILDRYSLLGCNGIITSGTFHHDSIKRLTSKNIEILVPGCIPMNQLGEWGCRKKTIVSWDRWDIGNNPASIIDIFERIKDKSVKLEIAGFWHPPEMKSNFISLIVDRGLSDRVSIIGPIDEAGIKELCSKASLHIHPIHEAFGMQTLEAAGYGCPGLMIRGSGVSELFEDNISGLLIKNNDLDGAVRKINFFFSNAEYAQKLGHNAWLVAKNFSWNHHAKNIEKIIIKNIKL